MVSLGIFSIQYMANIKQEISMLDRRNYLKISAVAVNAIMVSGTTIAQTGATNNKQSDTTSVYSNIHKN